MKKIRWDKLDSDIDYLIDIVKAMIDSLNSDPDSVSDSDVRRMRRIVKATITHLEEFNDLTDFLDGV